MHQEVKRAIKEGLLRRILPTFAALVIALIFIRPNWKPLSVGLALAVVAGFLLAFVLGRRVRAAGLSRDAADGAPVKVSLELRPLMLVFWLGVSVGLGYLTRIIEERLGLDFGEYPAAVAVPLILLGLGLSLRPKRVRDA